MHAHIPDDKLTAISDALFAGRKIEAIKTYREQTGLGLKEAKDDIEEIEAALRRDFPEKFVARPKGGGCFGAAAVFVVGACTVTTWFLLS